MHAFRHRVLVLVHQDVAVAHAWGMVVVMVVVAADPRRGQVQRLRVRHSPRRQ